MFYPKSPCQTREKFIDNLLEFRYLIIDIIYYYCYAEARYYKKLEKIMSQVIAEVKSFNVVDMPSAFQDAADAQFGAGVVTVRHGVQPGDFYAVRGFDVLTVSQTQEMVIITAQGGTRPLRESLNGVAGITLSSRSDAAFAETLTRDTVAAVVTAWAASLKTEIQP